MVTKMQRAFAGSKLLQRAVIEMFKDGGAPIRSRGYKRFFTSINKEVFANWPEPEITLFLLEALQCDDIRQEEIAEALHILGLAEMTLTTEQQQQLQDLLNE